ncbi:MAG TPA: hypothetical protein VE958_10545 [Bryobacteraceae bacterium]|nr:hypothetical protein [Bryobacteraceae bacterium]
MLPPLSGYPIRVELRRSLGPHLAATHIPRRRILLDSELLAQPGEFERILVHEIFHFAWVRLSNQTRRSWEGVLAAEIAARAPGELGWSSEWRKDKLTRADVRRRTPAWRRYVCESFCDTSAWLCAGLSRHGEYTLSSGPRSIRRRWFAGHLLDRLPILV